MSRTKKIVIAAAAVVLIAALTLTLCLTLLRKPEYVRDMSEVASRGSFVMEVEGQKDKLPDSNQTYVFKTYEEFVQNPIAELITYSEYKTIDGENIRFDYKAKNERYNRDYFEQSELMVAFFEATINAHRFIVKDVQIEGNTCTVEVYGEMPTGSWGLQEERDVLYACFLEKAEWDSNLTAAVEVGEIFVSESVPNHYYADLTTFVDLPDHGIHAYLIENLEQLNQFVEDNPHMTEGDPLAFSFEMKYTEAFFSEHALLIVEVPGDYYANILVEDHILTGVSLYSDHYYLHDSVETGLNNLSYTGVISVAVEKGFSPSEWQYRYCRYDEWEDGLTDRTTETEPVTLTEQTSGTAYRVYAQAQTEA